jgi:hypothetical protein
MCGQMLAPLRCEARPPRRQCEEAGPPPSVQSAVEEKSFGGLGEESERRERHRRGWAVSGFMARATNRRGVSRSFPRCAGEASRCTP